MDTIGNIRDLISIGEKLAPKGGEFYMGYNEKLQPEYVSWRLQAFASLDELGKSAQHLINELKSDKKGSYFYEPSASLVLGVLKAALAIAERQEQSPIKEKINIKKNIAHSNNKIFIVHGHEKALIEQVARFAEKLEIIPIILFEQPGKGNTVIEKLENNSDVACSIVLLTPDDVGKAAKEENLNPRARQNVILELGYFIGKLGRENVIVLYDESVELPSDYKGIEYVKIDPEGAWKLKIAKEMKAAGLKIDMNSAI